MEQTAVKSLVRLYYFFQIREQQLSQAAQLYKQRMNQLIQRYEMLLLAYG